MSRHHLPLKPEPPKYLMPELGNQLGKETMATWSRVTPLSISMKSSPTTLPSELHYLMDVNSLGLSSVTTQSSQMISAPMHLTCMEDNSNKLLLFGWEQLPEVNVNTSKLPMSLIGEPNADDQAWPPTQPLSQLNLNLLPLKSHSESLRGLLKHISEEEGTEWGKYAWNWKKPGGGPPWWDVDEASLPVVEKTYLLHNIYTANIKQALQSLESQRGLPDFPPLLWQDILANHQIDFGILAKD